MRTIIQNALVEAAKDGAFYPVTYDDLLGAQRGETPVAPASAEANEIVASFDVAGRRGASFGVDRRDWIFELILRFHQEVDLTTFEEDIAANPPCVTRSADMPRQARLLLSSASYTHPPRKGASNGTEARYRFEALLSPL